MIGQRLSHFRILEAIGAGGMGVVYRARDEQLGRDVAIKVLPGGALEGVEARRRFLGEARILSQMNHPNIAAVYEFGSQDGIDFLVLELVLGETLSDRIALGPLIERDIGAIGEQLARGLAAAHRSGILHRDIKPANLKVAPDGTLKILDFGLARMDRPLDELTRTRSVSGPGIAGTIPYMAPEQLGQGTVDARSDIHAVGAVLYEMACGQRAFPQADAGSVIAAILTQPPAPPSTKASALSQDVDRIVGRCLEKDPAQRYPSAEELESDLHQLTLTGPERRRVKGRGAARPAKHKVVPLIVAALATASVVAIAFDAGGIRERLVPRTGPPPSLAVLPMVNASGQPSEAYFVDGMTDELLTRLAQVPSLEVISRSSSMQYRGSTKSAPQIGRELKVDMLVQGTVERSGERVRIRAQLVDAAKDRTIWADTFEGTVRAVFRVQSDVTRSIVDKIKVRLTDLDRKHLARDPALDPEAHDAYLRGRYAVDQLNEEQIRSAVELFTRAVRLQPNYAEAWAGLASAYYQLSSTYVDPSEVLPKSRIAAKRAVELAPDLSEAHASLALVAMVDRDWQTMQRAVTEAIRLDPSNATAHVAYAGLLQIQGDLERSQAEYDRCRELDPLSNENPGIWCIYLRGRYDEAIGRLRSLVKLSPRDPQTWYNLGQCYAQKGQYGEAIACLEKAVNFADADWPLGMLGRVYALAGRRSDAAAVLDRMQKAEHLPPYCFALAYAGLGDRNRCFEWLGRAVQYHDDNVNNVKVDPAFASLRGDPRFSSLLHSLGLDAQNASPNPSLAPNAG